jgi:hypothetical protein
MGHFLRKYRWRIDTKNTCNNAMELSTIQDKIYEIRSQKVMLSQDLAALYEVETKVLNQAVARNSDRFPEDFMFQLSDEETKLLRSQIVTLGNVNIPHFRYNPYAFTEQGVAMLSSVLKSEKAVQVNIAILRTFVSIRKYAFEFQELRDKLALLEARFDGEIDDIHIVLNELINPDNQRRGIGFKRD